MNKRVRGRPAVGTVVQIRLPDGRYAYGRVLKDAGIGIYSRVSDSPGHPPIGDRDYLFVVGVYDHALRPDKVANVGVDPSQDSEEDWPPPSYMKDRISGRYSIYHHGQIRPSTEDECRGIEKTAVWDLHHIIERIMQVSNHRSSPTG